MNRLAPHICSIQCRTSSKSHNQSLILQRFFSNALTRAVDLHGVTSPSVGIIDSTASADDRDIPGSLELEDPDCIDKHCFCGEKRKNKPRQLGGVPQAT
jgi:hypothetical protein